MADRRSMAQFLMLSNVYDDVFNIYSTKVLRPQACSQGNHRNSESPFHKKIRYKRKLSQPWHRISGAENSLHIAVLNRLEIA